MRSQNYYRQKAMSIIKVVSFVLPQMRNFNEKIELLKIEKHSN